jgi:starvation-inducible DNA-binding protein
MNTTRNDLAAETRGKVTELLNARLADAIDLHLQAKQAHWNVKGPNFIALHELFDKFAEESEEYVDDIAERATALGGTAKGTASVVAKTSQLETYPLDIVNGRDHLTALANAVAKAGKAMRAAIDSAASLGDAGTSDLFTGISRELDKWLWFFEAHLQGER